MRKRSRRGRGRGRRGASSFVETVRGGDLVSTLTPSLGISDNSEREEAGGISADQRREQVRTSSDAVSDFKENIVEENLGVASSPALTRSLCNDKSNTGTTSSSSCSSVDGDGDSDAGDNEQMHAGFMQTGPDNYRIGSTVVNLNNCSEDDIKPEFHQNDICLQVECGDNKALMYMSKLYQGSKGKCIEQDGTWFTPNEFQAMSGRESAKDWKRSIRHHGRSLKLLLSKNVLDVHPAACRCDSCSQLQQLNCKTGPTGDTVKSTSNGDTSGEDTKFCNGAAGGKKRKRGKQPTPAAKMTTVTAVVTTSTTVKLEPIGIIIPQTLDKSNEEGDKVLEIPNMNSPLFKDIPSKKAESSSDSSSSSEGSSSSNDSSSSDDNSDDEEEVKKDENAINSIQNPESLQELPKPRTPIKLTISNLRKPSAKVISTATRVLTDIYSSDSETDMDDIYIGMALKVHTNPPLHGDINDSPQDSHIIANSDQIDAQNESLLSSKGTGGSNLRLIGNGQFPDNSGLTHIDSCFGDIKQTCNDIDLLNDSVFNFTKLDNYNINFQTVKSLEPSIPENDNFSKGIPWIGGPAVKATKDLLDTLKCGDTESELDIKKHIYVGFVCSDSEKPSLPLPNSKEYLSFEDKCIKPKKMDSVSLRDSCDAKYCPDGFILAPTLRRSPQHLKTSLSIPQNVLNSGQNLDGRNNSILETEPSSGTNNVCEKEKLKTSEDDTKQTPPDSNKPILLDDCKLNLPRHNKSLPKDEIYDQISEKKTSDKLFQVDKNDISGIKDKNLNTCISDSNDKNCEKSLITTKMNEHSCEIIHNKTPVESSRTTGPKCKGTTVSSQSLLKNTATKMAISITTTTTNSGSIMSPTTNTSTKTSGFTNGIPDSENPFITWTKYDDNSGSVNTSLPASSLVQALVGVPFPHLALSGESTISQISPLSVAVPQLSPLGLAGLSPGSSQLSMMSPGRQIPLLSSPGSQTLMSSPSNSTAKQQLSPPELRPISTGSNDENKTAHDEEGKIKAVQKSVKRTSRLSNIIDSLRTSKEKQAAGSSHVSGEQDKKDIVDVLFRTRIKSPSHESSSVTGQNLLSSSSSSSSPAFSPSITSDHRFSNDSFFHDSVILPHQIGTDAHHIIRSSLDATRVQTIDNSFSALKDDLDKGKGMLESLDIIKSGLLDPYSKPGLSDSKSRKMDNSNSQNRSKSSLFSSLSTAASTASRSSSRPPSRQSTKSSSQTYPSASPSSSSSRTNSTATTSINNLNGGSGSSINSSMFHVAPSASLAAAHMELNAAAANILTYQHMYGMQDPYMMKTLMSNPLYLQRMMEFQKHAMDPIMLRQLEMFEAAAAAKKSKNSQEHYAAMNAQSILWQAHAASILQHQQMQQIQQLQLHHQQQQLQQQAAVARERETRETIAAILASKSNNLSNHAIKSTGSISTGQSAKSLMATATSSSLSSFSPLLSSKRPCPVITTSSTDIYSRDVPSLEKKPRPSHQASSHTRISNHTENFSSSSSNTTSTSSFRYAQMSSKPASSSSSNVKPRISSSTSSSQSKQQFIDLPTALHLSATATPQLWGFPSLLQQPNVDMAHISRFFEQPSEIPSSSLSLGHAGLEATGAEVLDLSVKPKAGKT